MEASYTTSGTARHEQDIEPTHSSLLPSPCPGTLTDANWELHLKQRESGVPRMPVPFGPHGHDS